MTWVHPPLPTKDSPMAHRIVDALRRAFNHPYAEPSPHFHAHHGNPEVCFDASCVRPRLTV